MSKTTPAQNKALVLEAFDTLFNRRDYAAADRYWSDRYIQHSAHIAPGRSATKAALHSYVLSQRFLLKDAGVRVLEIAPPWVRTDLMNSREAEEAMPLDQFIAETMVVLGTDADEILVEGAKAFRGNVGPNEHGLVNGFNEFALTLFAA